MTNANVSTLDHIVSQVSRRLQNHEDKPIFIMVAGGSATGKSSQVIPGLLHAFGDRALLVEQDWYQLGLHFNEKDTSPYRWDDPRNFQIERLASDLRRLKDGAPVDMPAFDVVAVESKGTHHVTPHPVIVVDGIYALHGNLKGLADYSIYVAMPLYARFLRRLCRMIYDQGVNKPQTALKHTFGPVRKAHEEIVSLQAKVADCLVNIPYSFADTIDRYQLIPAGDIPQKATPVFNLGELCFYISDEGLQSHFYITYGGKQYIDFPFDKEYMTLLEGIDYTAL